MKRLVYDLETEGLRPWDHRIICIGVADLEKDDLQVFHDEDEETMIRDFIRFVRRRGFDEVIGYNVSFDNRFVMAKCLEYEVPCGFFFSDPHHIDLMRKVENPINMYSSNNSGALDDWVKYLFDEEKSEDNGDIPEMYSRGEIEKIKSYCRKDVRITAMLWKRLKDVGVL